MSPERGTAARRLEQRLRAPDVRAGVMGLGFIGTTLMDALAAAGIRSHGVDRDPRAVLRFRGHAEAARTSSQVPWSVGGDAATLGECDVIFVAVRALVDGGGSVDTEPVEAAFREIADHRRDATLVLLETTLPPGTTRELARRLADRTELFIAHSPERLSSGQDWRQFKRFPHLVGGVDEPSTKLGRAFLSRICDEVVPVASPEVSELSKLLENAFLTVGIGLVGEITRMAHALGIDATDVCNAAATKPIGYYAFQPGPGVGGHCLPNDLQILASVGRRFGWHTPLLAGTAEVVGWQPGLVVDRVECSLPADSRSLRRKSVLLVGMGFKIGSPDTTLSPAFDVIRELRRRGAMPSYLDSQVPEVEVDGQEVERVTKDELGRRRFAAAIVLSGDATVQAKAVERAADLVLDAGGGRLLRGGLLASQRL